MMRFKESLLLLGVGKRWTAKPDLYEMCSQTTFVLSVQENVRKVGRTPAVPSSELGNTNAGSSSKCELK